MTGAPYWLYSHPGGVAPWTLVGQYADLDVALDAFEHARTTLRRRGLRLEDVAEGRTVASLWLQGAA